MTLGRSILPVEGEPRLLDPSPEREISSAVRKPSTRVKTHYLSKQNDVLSTNKKQAAPYFSEDVPMVYSFHSVLQNEICWEGYLSDDYACLVARTNAHETHRIDHRTGGLLVAFDHLAGPQASSLTGAKAREPERGRRGLQGIWAQGAP